MCVLQRRSHKVGQEGEPYELGAKRVGTGAGPGWAQGLRVPRNTWRCCRDDSVRRFRAHGAWARPWPGHICHGRRHLKLSARHHRTQLCSMLCLLSLHTEIVRRGELRKELGSEPTPPATWALEGGWGGLVASMAQDYRLVHNPSSSQPITEHYAFGHMGWVATVSSTAPQVPPQCDSHLQLSLLWQ